MPFPGSRRAEPPMLRSILAVALTALAACTPDVITPSPPGSLPRAEARMASSCAMVGTPAPAVIGLLTKALAAQEPVPARSTK